MSTLPAVTPVLELTGVLKNYRALRPLRIESLQVHAGDRLALAGLDAGAAEVLINLITGAGLPDAGDVRVFGRSTAEISGGDEWLASLDRFGIVSPRAVLLEGASIEQNLAMPFTLQLDPVPAEVTARVVDLARTCGISVDDGSWLRRRAGEAPPDVRVRVHLARAVALEPDLLLLEHPTADIAETSRLAFAADLVGVVCARRLTTLIITQDERFARRVAHRALRLKPGTGVLEPLRRGWFG